MRISDWSSDVCSSDLQPPPHEHQPRTHAGITAGLGQVDQDPRQVEHRSHPRDHEYQVRGLGPDVGLHAGDSIARLALGSHGARPERSQTPLWTLWERPWPRWVSRSEEHTSELQSLMRISYAVFCLKK